MIGGDSVGKEGVLVGVARSVCSRTSGMRVAVSELRMSTLKLIAANTPLAKELPRLFTTHRDQSQVWVPTGRELTVPWLRSLHRDRPTAGILLTAWTRRRECETGGGLPARLAIHRLPCPNTAASRS